MSAKRVHDMASIVIAAADSGLRGIIEQLSQTLDAPCGIFDSAGNALAVFPERSLINFSEVRLSLSEAGPKSLWVKRVDVSGETLAFLVSSRAPDNELAAVTEAALVLELGRLRARLEGRRELASQIVDDVLSERTSDFDAHNRFQLLGFDLETSFRVLIQLDDADQVGELATGLNLQAAISGRDEQMLRIRRSGYFLTLMPDGPGVAHVAKSLVAVNGLGQPLNAVGVSRTHSGARGLRLGYFEALSALDSGLGVQNPEKVSVSRLLLAMNQKSDMQAVVREYLQPILRDGSLVAGQSPLFDTIRAYFSSGRSISLAAEQLFVHRNTLRYRLAQIEEQLGVNLNSAEDVSDLWLALLVATNGDKGKAEVG